MHINIYIKNEVSFALASEIIEFIIFVLINIKNISLDKVFSFLFKNTRNWYIWWTVR